MRHVAGHPVDAGFLHAERNVECLSDAAARRRIDDQAASLRQHQWHGELAGDEV
jgi:hypothetical protein